MKFSEIFEKIESSKEFSDFKKKYKKSYFYAAFIMFGFEANEVKSINQQLDFMINGDAATISLNENNEVEIKIEEVIKKEKLPEIEKKEIYAIEINKIPQLVKSEIEKQKIAGWITKIVAVLYKHDGLKWDITCILESFKMIKLKIDASSNRVIESKISSIFDFVQKLDKIQKK